MLKEGDVVVKSFGEIPERGDDMIQKASERRVVRVLTLVFRPDIKFEIGVIVLKPDGGFFVNSNAIFL